MLPLMGTVPDMKADSSRYVLVQNWFVLKLLDLIYSYRRKFKLDLEHVSNRVQRILHDLGRDVKEISLDEIEAFCKHAGYLKVIRFRSLEEEYTSPQIKFIRIVYIS